MNRPYRVSLAAALLLLFAPLACAQAADPSVTGKGRFRFPAGK